MGRLLTNCCCKWLLFLCPCGSYVRCSSSDVEPSLRSDQVFEEMVWCLLTGAVGRQHIICLGSFVNLGQQVPTGLPVECNFEIDQVAHDQHMLGLYLDGSLLAGVGVPDAHFGIFGGCPVSKSVCIVWVRFTHLRERWHTSPEAA